MRDIENEISEALHELHRTELVQYGVEREILDGPAIEPELQS